MPPKKKSKKQHSSSVAVLKANLDGAEKLLAAHVTAGLDADTTRDKLFQSLFTQASELGIDHHEAVLVLASLNSGPWTPGQTQQFATMLCGLDSANGTSDETAKDKNQHCHFCENMLLPLDWVHVRNRSLPLIQRAQTLATAALRVNLKNPDEKTLFRLVAILAYGDHNWQFTQEEVFYYMDQIQTFIKAGMKHREHLPYIVNYPISAEDLPDGIKAEFGGTLPPVVHNTDLDTILAGMKQRGRKKQNESDEPAWMKLLPEAARAQARKDIYMRDDMQAAGQPSQSMRYDMQAARQPSHASQLNHFTPFLPSANECKREIKYENDGNDDKIMMEQKDDKMKMEQLQPPSVTDQNSLHFAAKHTTFPVSQDLLPQSENQSDSLLEMERALGVADSHDKGKKPKKPTAAPKVLMRKPAAAPKVTMKRPAASCKKRPARNPITTYSSAALKLERTIDMTDIFAKLRTVLNDEGMTRNKFTCRAYKNGESRALARKASSKVAKDFARMQLNKASDMWSKHFA
jgi:hypothetical protein